MFAVPAFAAQDHCHDLAGYDGEGVTIVSARSQAARPAAGDKPAVASHCLIEGVATRVEGSRIGFQVRLPQRQDWTRRLRMYGNGGYSSAMPVEALEDAVSMGYVAVATDTGHMGDDPAFAIGRPASIDDWAWRAVHESVAAAKGIAQEYYGDAPKFSYFLGCSTGGHQALMEAQRFPQDFDGIVAGAPGNNRTRLNLGFLWQFMSTHDRSGALTFAPAKLRLLTRHALKSCGSADEQAAGFLLDPLSCRPDPAALQCAAGGEGAADCLTAGEVVSARAMYAGAHTKDGQQIYPPWLPGSESVGPPNFPLPGWSLYWADPQRPDRPARESFFRFWAFPTQSWRWQDFDFDTALENLDALSARIDAIDPDLSAFHASGGRLLQFHGMADPVVSPWDSVAYHRSVVAEMGARTDDFYRLFMVPGMAHCAGGAGYGSLETDTAIERWVEQGQAPDHLTATRSTPRGDDKLPVSLQLKPWDGRISLAPIEKRPTS